MKPLGGARRALAGAAWLSGASYLSFLLNFGLNLLLVRLLFPKDFGQFALAGSLAELLSLVTGASLPQGVIQMWGAPKIVETAYVLSLKLYGMLMLGGALVALLASAHFPGRFVPLFFTLLAVRNISVISYVYSALLERRLDYYPIALVRLSATLASVIVTLVLAHAGAGVWSLLGREAVLSVITFLGMRIASGWRYSGGYDRETARRLWEFGRQMFVGRALETLWYRSDTVILGILAGTASLGFYDRARYLGELGHYAVSLGAVQVAYPVYSSLQHDRGTLSYTYKLSHGLLVRLLCPYLLWLMLFPRELVSVLYGSGERWSGVALILPWFAIFGFLFPLVDNLKVLLTGVGRLRAAVCLRFAQVLLTLGLLVPAVRLAGAQGAAAVMMLSQIGGLVIGYRGIHDLVLDLNIRSYIRPLVCAALAGGAVAIVRGLHVLAWKGRLGDAATLFIVGCLYVVCLLLVDREQLREQVGAIVNRFKGSAPEKEPEFLLDDTVETIHSGDGRT